ncbi:MAG: hypothetical protein QG670_899 [Thermoproteota archaeon]|nr:hypothetical protein [Thermoproteota archaeon]
MSTLRKIDCIEFYVSNLEEAEAFYSSVLGLRKVWTDNAHGMIGFVCKENDSEIVIHTDSTRTKPSFCFSVEDVEKFCDEYQKLGYKIVKAPFDVRCGKYAILGDPFGNMLPIIDLTKFGNKPRYD